ncbi:MAG: cytochrome c oxidase accessory protein CcoG [Gammaproteobacteria bacterium]
MFFYGFATWGNAGFMREQVCTYMCPYARFQSAMFDKDTLIISYDEARGEPRGSRRKSDDPKDKGLGDCVNCTLCVQVCPTGIDIRDGLQYQCIGCAACIDACDEVMDKMGYPKGLVRYTTQHALDGTQTHVIRPRMLVYATILVVITAGVFWSILNRTPLQLDVIRDRNSLFRETFTGTVENVYVLKLINMDEKSHRYEITASGVEGMKLKLDKNELTIASGDVLDLPARIEADPENLSARSTEISFEVRALDDPELKVVQDARFLGPIPSR